MTSREADLKENGLTAWEEGKSGSQQRAKLESSKMDWVERTLIKQLSRRKKGYQG